MSHKQVVIMAILTTLLFYGVVSVCLGEDTWDTYTNDQIVNAIYKAEGGLKTRFPYGVKSIKCSTTQKCRKICLNSVRNGRSRWERAGRPDDLIIHIGKRYSPPSINPNWVRLVKYFLRKQ